MEEKVFEEAEAIERQAKLLLDPRDLAQGGFRQGKEEEEGRTEEKAETEEKAALERDARSQKLAELDEIPKNPAEVDERFGAQFTSG